MKKFIVFLLLLLCSCEAPQNGSTKKKVYGHTYTWQILVIDSCEYVWVTSDYKGGLTHKGNCKFCKKRN